MNYSAKFNKAKKDGLTEDMTYKAFEFKTAGDSVVGELVDHQETFFGQTNSTVNKYILKTDDGLVSVILGAIGDAQLKGRINAGDLLFIEFKEKKELSGGRKANIFNIVRVPSEESRDGEENDETDTD